MTKVVTSETPLIGVSACLLGSKVRYNGGHKQDHWLTEELQKHISWHPVCPEVSMGLGVPRESLRLKRFEKQGSIRLVGVRSEMDHTDLAQAWAQKWLNSLPHLNGFILKNRSPSCGLEKVKVYAANNIPFNNGTGIFAQALTQAFPLLPVIEEGRLNNPNFREHFVTRVFAHFYLSKVKPVISEIQKFHESYKFIIQAHHEPSLRILGRVAANSQRHEASSVLGEYRQIFLKALSHSSSTGKRSNVLQHIYGFIKDKTTDLERQSIHKNLEAYRQGKLPFIAMLTLIQHLLDKYKSPYIEKQRFLLPYPAELRLNHEI